MGCLQSYFLSLLRFIVSVFPFSGFLSFKGPLFCLYLLPSCWVCLFLEQFGIYSGGFRQIFIAGLVYFWPLWSFGAPLMTKGSYREDGEDYDMALLRRHINIKSRIAAAIFRYCRSHLTSVNNSCHFV